MGIEEGTFWDEHWVLYGNQFDNKLHILKKKKEVQLFIPHLWREGMGPLMVIVYSFSKQGTQTLRSVTIQHYLHV